jgi:hypothetical protein
MLVPKEAVMEGSDEETRDEDSEKDEEITLLEVVVSGLFELLERISEDDAAAVDEIEEAAEVGEGKT